MDTTIIFEIDGVEEAFPLFRTLSPEEEAEFRAYARANFTAETPLNTSYHPVVQDEMIRMGCK